MFILSFREELKIHLCRKDDVEHQNRLENTLIPPGSSATTILLKNAFNNSSDFFGAKNNSDRRSILKIFFLLCQL